jgi:hypothetical protein
VANLNIIQFCSLAIIYSFLYLEANLCYKNCNTLMHIFTLMNFVVNNQGLFQTNSAIHGVNTRNRDHFHRPTAKLSCFQKSAYYAGIIIFNSLPLNLRSLMNKQTQFKVALKRYLSMYSFYSVEEFLTFKVTHNTCKSFSLTVCCVVLV